MSKPTKKASPLAKMILAGFVRRNPDMPKTGWVYREVFEGLGWFESMDIKGHEVVLVSFRGPRYSPNVEVWG